ncbi:uncharacterized protein BO96DRAFT_470622 [Aspergillus niger CBS 101883]|uniref:Contig An03c0200, genomic contig n=3 Tax=Aspergillus niger TaxID=5061 RepID=A2QHH8_ASPNC|nr:uncharacterized protein BO96DRAFT_470622 [Aspergillus niger CBS 101883]XP_059600399.1 uncharacterized protein An03g06915 [Aspergillus niger]PYH50661.1 hypothetical protein BO96DRAFT_470622 [Aspergillus niger CBS 101883]RDH23008.1 hypothetical protein M747DRAFT_256081 [Aspergillus niger ATCC 13496]CAK38448.1 unnamed protein product [Aspergillus niger]
MTFYFLLPTNQSEYCTATTVYDPMPHLPIVQCDASITTQNIRKRKRETVLADISPALSNRLSSSAIHDTNPQFCLDNTGCLGDSTGVFTRQRCLHRKRRVFQQPPANHKPPFTDGISQMPLSDSSQNTCISGACSPPVSPKTICPIPYQQPQTLCASASCLRPCHICHRRPTTREYVDAYADCDLCGGRSCYICLRHCDSVDCSGLLRTPTSGLQERPDDDEWQTERARKVCSACAVEGVTESGKEVIRCLECVRGLQSQWQALPLD